MFALSSINLGLKSSLGGAPKSLEFKSCIQKQKLSRVWKKKESDAIELIWQTLSISWHRSEDAFEATTGMVGIQLGNAKGQKSCF